MKAVILILNVTLHFLIFHKCLIYTSYIPSQNARTTPRGSRDTRDMFF